MSKQQLLGIHHVTAMTSDVVKNYEFFTEILGMRLVKKTVNQDDIYTYHTFYADDQGSPGTDMTFFDFPNNPPGIKGTNAITRTSFRVPTDEALTYWVARFEEFNVKHEGISELFGKKVLKFEDEDQQRYQLISDETNQGVKAGIPWKKGPVPLDYAIYGLGPIEITLAYFERFKEIMTSVYGFKMIEEVNDMILLEIGEGGNGAQMILRHDATSPIARQGYGEVHHVAFRVADQEALYSWLDKYQRLGIPNSGHVDRFYFEALYARIGHILIELSTDGPGFMGDEPYETLGESLSLPPFLENRRAYIESEIRPFNTKREE
ncbi:ring-cleaving dioxygenase [Vagococcus zengguangii]|uniref:Ring-cleaving dioxygenase n=1 Tax=Vagococcus zengguangii TaxID=2571750 RepID=A0A4D7CVU9_9ENTE|nr:ring-cleaving dioxygenase [Vagococcus zengguangii]QCI86387.1 ring-cleaving dioxygenase [Vagococcus zengguangii]TLG81363.1 ring-cleaving dioxygenase [Vagococcus zengguangii]